MAPVMSAHCELFGLQQRQAADGAHRLRAVEQGQPLFGFQNQWGDVGAAERLPPERISP